MIEGLRLAFSGEQLVARLEETIRRHEERASRWRAETLRTAEDETQDAPLLPHHICEHEADRHTCRAMELAFIRDHVDVGETYRLDATDLRYAELLPDKPGWLEYEEYEERTRIGFTLERLVRSVDRLGAAAEAWRRPDDPDPVLLESYQKTVAAETAGYRGTSIDVDDGPEIVMMERK